MLENLTLESFPGLIFAISIAAVLLCWGAVLVVSIMLKKTLNSAHREKEIRKREEKAVQILRNSEELHKQATAIFSQLQQAQERRADEFESLVRGLREANRWYDENLVPNRRLLVQFFEYEIERRRDFAEARKLLSPDYVSTVLQSRATTMFTEHEKRADQNFKRVEVGIKQETHRLRKLGEELWMSIRNQVPELVEGKMDELSTNVRDELKEISDRIRPLESQLERVQATVSDLEMQNRLIYLLRENRKGEADGMPDEEDVAFDFEDLTMPEVDPFSFDSTILQSEMDSSHDEGSRTTKEPGRTGAQTSFDQAENVDGRDIARESGEAETTVSVSDFKPEESLEWEDLDTSDPSPEAGTGAPELAELENLVKQIRQGQQPAEPSGTAETGSVKTNSSEATSASLDAFESESAEGMGDEGKDAAGNEDTAGTANEEIDRANKDLSDPAAETPPVGEELTEHIRLQEPSTEDEDNLTGNHDEPTKDQSVDGKTVERR